jgi:putative membrane protein
MIMKVIGFNKVVLAAVCALAMPAFADDTMTTNEPAAQMMTPADFAWDAALINLKEIRLGEAAQSNSQNTAVQEFGRHMVRDHSKMNESLMRIAAGEGLQLPDTNTFYIQVTAPAEKPATELMNETPQQKLLDAQEDVQQLASLTGPDFDRAYIDAMVKGHEKAMQKFEDASASVQDKALKKYAGKGLKTIHHHYEMAQQLQTDVAAGTNAPSEWPRNPI